MTFAEVARTTTFRWTLGIALALIVQSVVLSGLFYWSTVRHATAEVDQKLAMACRDLRSRGRAEILEEVGDKVNGDIHRENLVGLFDARGTVLAGNMARLPPALVTDNGPLVIDLVRSIPPDTIPNSSRAVACSTRDGDRLVFAQDMDELDYISALIGRALLLVTVPALAFAIGLGIVLGRRGQRRFHVVQSAVEDVMNGNLGQRLPVRSSLDPFDRLSLSVNAMLDKLETALDDVRALGDDIAHELRTPLTRLRARLERGCLDATTPSAFQAVGEQAIRDIDHALSIVSAILRIRAIEEAERGSEFAPVALRGLLRDAADLYKPIADDRQIELVVETGADMCVVADRDLLMEAICNLIDNAIKFTPPGGRVRCALERGEDPPMIRIADNGPGIPRAERLAVLRRFHRGGEPPSAAGHGIGLSLVAAIVRLHRFKLEIADSLPGCEMVIVCGDTADRAQGLRSAFRLD